MRFWERFEKILVFFIYRPLALLAQIPILPSTPCKPNSCGPNSQCQPRNDEPVCTCLPDFIGSPPNCRAECISNNECSNHLACINKKCQNPCVGSCGANANCHVVSHTPMCSCINGYTGDPFTQCILRERKYDIREFNWYNFGNLHIRWHKKINLTSKALSLHYYYYK